MDEEDENEVLDCPKCGREYDEIDVDFMICHHCGYDAEKKGYARRVHNHSIQRYGIDPDVQLDDWG